MLRLLLPLNDTVVLFLHPDDTQLSAPHVVQVTIKSDLPETVNIIAAFYLVHHDITDLVNRIVTAHLQNPLPSFMIFEDSRYTLQATHTKWPFGKTIAFSWGEDTIMACEDKWTFVFKPGAPLVQRRNVYGV
ncbi:hypothetical protein A0H81_12545 [Grifola frondosa]|uniref:Uncharacterized protein n=1 Tax=Grifola frondosa TaxID=5627 RepID=A0A1C7LX71_GRIFR|nr:hypothetical protein A0H81_12545 [Grifola frondosa]